MLGDVSAVFSNASAAKSIISANLDTEYIQSFTRVDIGDDSDEDRGEEGKPLKKKSDYKSRRKDRKSKKEEEDAKKDEGKPASPRVPPKSTFAQISKELKARKQAQMAAAAKARKSRKNKVRKQEEIYTDKDRAAAVNMGTRDIKQSLKLKKKQDRNFQIPEEAEPGTLLALGNNELRSGDVKIALKFVNKALELNPGDKNSLVARSKCYLLLGEPSLALQDAESALSADKTFIRAIHQKAEALYHLGDFEHSLMYYHRGHRLRPELEIFRLGVQKAQEAIENTIGCVPGLNGPQKTVPVKTRKAPETNRSGKSSATEKLSEVKSGSSGKSERKTRSKSAASSIGRETKSLLGELGNDRIYLENLLKNPDIICSNQEATSIIIAQAEEGIAFLKSRQEFWRQQRPNTAQPPSRSKLEIMKVENQTEPH